MGEGSTFSVKIPLNYIIEPESDEGIAEEMIVPEEVNILENKTEE